MTKAKNRAKKGTIKMKTETDAPTAPTAPTANPPPDAAPAAAPAMQGMSPLDVAAITAHAVRAALQELGIGAAAAASPAAPVDLRPMDDPTFEEGPPQARFEFKTGLLQRHADWLSNTARNFGMSREEMLELLVRKAYAADPTKGGTILVALPTEKGQSASSAPRNR